jgi:mRNA interferase HicA
LANKRRSMKYSEFRKWLRKQGATFEKHKSGSSHYRVTLNGKTTIFPDHGAKEMGTNLVEAIKRQLGIK